VGQSSKMDTKTKVDILQEFKETLDRKSTYVTEIYRHLFSFFTDDEFREILTYLKKEYKRSKKEWFFYFHKSIRQTDFFDNQTNIRAFRISDKLTPKEKRRRNFLKKKWSLQYKEFKKLHPDENYEEYKKFRAQPKCQEVLIELKKLNGIAQSQDEIRMMGDLDMILWNMIHVDKENELKNLLEKVFKNV
jgi:hypothetical protein